MKSALNHVAILVENIEFTLEKLPFSPNLFRKIEKFSHEGTREIYIGQDKNMGRILLVQAIDEGPYRNALRKRGAGLHHIALNVIDIDEYLEGLLGSGWLLHPKSIKFYKDSRQVYLSRPGVPVLIEVQESKASVNNDCFIGELKFPFREMRLLESLDCGRLKIGKDIKFIFEDYSFGKELWS